MASSGEVASSLQASEGSPAAATPAAQPTDGAGHGAGHDAAAPVLMGTQDGDGESAVKKSAAAARAAAPPSPAQPSAPPRGSSESKATPPAKKKQLAMKTKSAPKSPATVLRCFLCTLPQAPLQRFGSDRHVHEACVEATRRGAGLGPSANKEQEMVALQAALSKVPLCTALLSLCVLLGDVGSILRSYRSARSARSSALGFAARRRLLWVLPVTASSTCPARRRS